MVDSFRYVYRIEIVETALKEIRNLPPSMWSELRKTMSALAQDPYPQDVVRLPFLNACRLGGASWYLLYEVDDANRTVRVDRVLLAL